MNWARAIPLVTLLAVVFSAGIIYAKIDGLTKSVEKIEPRVEALEGWRIEHTAETRTLIPFIQQLQQHPLLLPTPKHR